MAEAEDKEQKTEEASPRRKADARDRGQVPLSTEFVAASSLAAGLAVLAIGGGRLMETLAGGTVRSIAALPTLGKTNMDVQLGAAILKESLQSSLGALALVTVPTILIGAAAGYLQVGFKFTPMAVQPDLSKFNLVSGTKRLLSARSFVRTGMAVLKIVLITSVVAAVAWHYADGVVRASTNELGPLLAALGHLALRCIAGALSVILVLACIDLLYQRYQHAKDLRMSKKELKEEAKQADGDPKVKARIRQLQQEFALKRMMADVPKATVVVTNPTHYAVALLYERDDEDAARAPVVVAKGVDHLAQRIKATAIEANVVCYEDVPLARALYAQADIGDQIPEELYAAVATVLGYVYRLRARGGVTNPGASAQRARTSRTPAPIEA